MTFNTLGLAPEILSALAEKGYSEPTPIQKQAIPVIIEGNDVMAGSQTGTGKTAAFTLPLLQRLTEASHKKNRRVVRALILTPTRELAAQVYDNVRTYGKNLPFSSTVVFGGINISNQIRRLRSGVNILVATPGRLLDHVRRGTVDLSRVEILVLDEADRMLDMGFMPDVRSIISEIPKQRQSLLFFATFSPGIKKIARELLKDPALIEVAKRNTAAKSVTQVIHPVDKARKRELLAFLISSKNWQQVLVFTRTKHGANCLSEQLENDGLSSDAIHGNKSQAARTRALERFKRGKTRVLVATDVASRGIDIATLPHVVNFELPEQAEDYVHRIGRTGRAGKNGLATSLVCVDELKLLRDIQQLLNTTINQVVINNFKPDPTIRPQPIRQKYKPRGKKKFSARAKPRSSNRNRKRR